MISPTSIALRREPGPLARSLTALILRLGLGLVFLMAGLDKIEMKKAGNYPPDQLVKPFHDAIDKPLTNPVSKVLITRPNVKLFIDVLPYAEAGLGACLIAGFCTTMISTLTGVLLVHLLFGITVQGNAAMYPAMLTYLMIDAAVIWLSPVTSNYLSIDGLLFGWFLRPRSEGEYRRHESEKEEQKRKKA